MEKKHKIVLNIPHSSTNGICSKRSGWPLNLSFINHWVRDLTDWYTDIIFTQSEHYDASVVFPYSRFCCDAERLENDPMEKIGQGILYSKYHYLERNLSQEDKEYWLSKYYEHQQNLANELCEDSILIDCHSFLEKDNESDVCIGFNDDWSYDKRIVDIIKHTFIDFGFTVSINTPYSNSITPKCPFKYKSVMIELNKNLYMDTKTLELKGLACICKCLDTIYERLSICEINKGE